MLHVRRLNDHPDGHATVVALHGFTQTGQMFEAIARSVQGHVLAVDLPGHGQSADPVDLASTITAISEVIRTIDGPVVLVGYSMGGRLALHAAVEHSRELSGLVLVSSGPGIRDDTRRAERRESDLNLAARIADMTIEAFIDEWLAGPVVALDPAASDARVRLDRAMRAENDPARLAQALRAFGQGVVPALSDRQLDRITVPVLLVSGSRDAAYSASLRTLATAIPGAEHVEVAAAGHNVGFDAPEQLAAVINRAIDV